MFPERLFCAIFTKMMTMFGSQEVAPLVSNKCKDWVEGSGQDKNNQTLIIFLEAWMDIQWYTVWQT